MNYCKYQRFLLFSLLFLVGCEERSRISYEQTEFVRFLHANFISKPSVLSSDTLILAFQVRPSYHIMSDTPGGDFIPSKLSLNPPQDIILGSIQYPPFSSFPLQGTKDTLRVFEDKLLIKVPLLFSKKNLDSYQIKGSLYYQACDEQKCFFPRRLEFIAEK